MIVAVRVIVGMTKEEQRAEVATKSTEAKSLVSIKWCEAIANTTHVNHLKNVLDVNIFL